MKLWKILILLLPHITSASILIEKAAFFANSAFKEFITAIVWQHENSDDVTEFIKRYQGCIVLTPAENGNFAIIQEFNKNRSYTQTVFFATKVQELEHFIEALNKDLVLPIRLIVVLTKPATFSEMTELMKISWNNDVANILVVNSYADDVMLTTYFPYSNEKCGDSTPVHLDHETKVLFPKKFGNFHGCEIRTTLLNMSPYSRVQILNDTFISLSGIDGNVLKILFTLLNASMNVVSAKDHGGIGSVVNGTATGSFADLVSRKADILCPALIMTYLKYPYVQFSYSFKTVNIFWFGPRRLEISEWLRVLQPFMSNITSAFLTASIVFVVVTTLVRRFGLHRSFTRESVIFQSFTIFLGQEIKFEMKSWLTNSLFMMWIWFCMVVRIAYQGDLVHGLQNTILENPLQTFETAVAGVDGYGGIESMRDFYKGTQYYSNFKVIPLRNISHHLKAIDAGKKFLLVSDLLLGLDSAPNIQILYDDPVTEGPVCFNMRPGWPAAPEIDRLLIRMLEVGLLHKVLKEYYWEVAKNTHYNGDRNVKPLTLDILFGCFYAVGVLYVVCIFILLMEIIIYHKIK